MLIVEEACKEHFGKVKEFARRTGQLEQLEKQLKLLENYGDETRCLLYSGFAPYSFAFMIQSKSKKGEWQNWFNGGLIYHRKYNDFGGDWKIHTLEEK